jgi:hypothetical protein
VDKSSATISVSKNLHMKYGNQKQQKYSDLIDWNSRGQDGLNPFIKRPPLVFPTTAEEVGLMKSEMDQAMRIFEKEASTQMDKATKLHISKVLYVG